MVYTNYGDKGLLDGGRLAAEDTTREGCYYVLTIDQYPEPDENGNDIYRIQDCYVDVNDSWINWARVGGLRGFRTEWEAIDAVEYYGGDEFRNNYSIDTNAMTEEEVIEYLKQYPISPSHIDKTILEKLGK